MNKLSSIPGIVLAIIAAAFGDGPDAGRSPELVETAIAQAGENGPELRKALTTVPAEQREGVQFLIENMPAVDLRSLPASYLLENTALACDAVAMAPWRAQIPREIFLNEVLPYASLNERREDWRRRLREIAVPLVKECQRPGDAAQALNRQLFKAVKVRYSTDCAKPDQSALETIESGLATCTGLSILLVNACRAVGVPARIAGTRMWTNMRGNHTWVEIWDGTWHFLGAAEPDAQGLDHGWFQGDAARAKSEVRQHAIYASSFRKTGDTFPLMWDESLQWVPALNITARYAAPVEALPPDKVRLLVRVLDREGGERIAAKVTITDPREPSVKIEGTSRDGTSDNNDILPFTLAPDRTYLLRVTQRDKVVQREVKTVGDKVREQTITIPLGN